MHLWLYQFYLEAGGYEREPEALKAIMGKDQRIINWDTLEVIYKSEETW